MKNIKPYMVMLILLLCSLPSLADVTLKIEQPRNNGGYPIVSYTIEVRELGSKAWKNVGKVSYQGFYTLFNYDRVEEGKTYEFRVKAINQAGVGKPTDPMEISKYNPDIDYILNIKSEDGQSK